MANLHAVIEIPKGKKIPQFTHLPDIETFARNEKERSLITMFRLLGGTGSPYFIGPGTKDRMQILQAAFRKAYDDAEFEKNTRKLSAMIPRRSIRKTIKSRSQKSRATQKL